MQFSNITFPNVELKIYIFNQGPQGPQGVQGEKGPQGEGYPGPKVIMTIFTK